MHQESFCIIDYIDDYIGMGVPIVADKSFQFLLKSMERLGLSGSQKKLVSPSTQLLVQINQTVQQWLSKHTCTKRELQPILGLLLYVHKYVRPFLESHAGSA